MSRFTRSPRRPDHWASTHERARARAAERIGGDLDLTEAAWLDDHLTECPACATVAEAYDADRLALRSLRDLSPQPPRDLWARTAAAIELASAGRDRWPERSAGRRSLPLGVMSGIAIIAVVVGVSALSSAIRTGPTTEALPEPSTEQRSTTGGDTGSTFSNPDPTPFEVGAGQVQYLLRETSGALAMNSVVIDEVCHPDGASRCPALGDEQSEPLRLTALPRTIIRSPVGNDAIVVARDGADGDRIVVVALPDASMSPTPSPASQTPATLKPVVSEKPTDAGPSGTAPTTPPPVTPPSVDPSSPDPDATPDVEATTRPSEAPSAAPTPSLSPEPTVAASLDIAIAIASDIDVVGGSAAFSSDGTWFAFTARPTDGSGGPDVFVWRVGEPTASRLTEDGVSMFASWDGDQVLASRPHVYTADTTGSPSSPVSVQIDPQTGVETAAGTLWLPAVDPTRTRALGWNGSIQRTVDASGWTPADGRLELRAWPTEAGGQANAAPSRYADARILGEEIGDFDIRWDETGGWVAVWMADANDPRIGRLSLFRADPAAGGLELLDNAPNGVAALAGFSIGDGRLAWASPPGQSGEGSRIQIVAWSVDGVGSVRSAPGKDLVIVQ